MGAGESYPIVKRGKDDEGNEWSEWPIINYFETFYVDKKLRPTEDVVALIFVHMRVWPSEYDSHVITKAGDNVRLTVKRK